MKIGIILGLAVIGALAGLEIDGDSAKIYAPGSFTMGLKEAVL